MSVPTSLGSLVIFLGLAAPGLLFELGLSRRLSYLRRSVPDRIFRFVQWSLLFDVVLFPVGFLLIDRWPSDAQDISRSDTLLLWGAGLGVTVVPYALGAFVASGRGGIAKRAAFGADPAPLAWHLVWADIRSRSTDEDVYVRCHLRDSDAWVAGVWVTSSDDPDDMFLLPRLACDPATGLLVTDPSTGAPVPMGWGLWLRTSDLDQVEVQ